jgi:hypothetical protein
MSQLPAHEILGRIFGVIIRAAEKDPAFAQELMQALSSGIAENSSTGGQKSKLRRLFDPSGFHAINILRAHGEDALRGKLEQVRATADLRSVAMFSGLVLFGPGVQLPSDARGSYGGNSCGGQALRSAKRRGRLMNSGMCAKLER